MTATEELVEDLVDLQAAEKESRSQAVKDRLQRVSARRVRSRPGVPKAVAAKLLGVSVTTLNKWVERGRIAVVRDERTNRELIASGPLARVLVQVRGLRSQGAKTGLLAEAIATLEREDADYQREFAELYGASLQAIAENRLKSVVLPATFGPDD